MKMTKTFYTETAHRLPEHPGLCKFIHGHSYRWDISLVTGQLNLDGMIEDFKQFKTKVGIVLDAFDHATVLMANDPLAELIRDTRLGNDITKFFRLVYMDVPPTAENMAEMVAREVQDMYPSCGVHVKLWETATSSVEAQTF